MIKRPKIDLKLLHPVPYEWMIAGYPPNPNDIHITDQERRIFDVIVNSFAAIYTSHKGLYLIHINQEISNEYDKWVLVYKLTGKVTPKDEFLKRYEGKDIGSVIQNDFILHSKNADGAILLDFDGKIIDDHRIVRRNFPEYLPIEAKTGTAHISLASASLNPYITSFVCSAEKGTVKTFKKGQLIRELFYEK